MEETFASASAAYTFGDLPGHIATMVALCGWFCAAEVERQSLCGPLAAPSCRGKERGSSQRDGSELRPTRGNVYDGTIQYVRDAA